jgi:hypothetical protein
MSQVVKVVLEYSPAQQRVIVRGVFRSDQEIPPPLMPTHQRNVVTVFLGVDMHWHVGFAGLVPNDEV